MPSWDAPPSFGRPAPPREELQPLPEPPEVGVALVAVKPVLDAETSALLAEQLREIVAAAVKAGFEQAIRETAAEPDDGE